MTTRSAKGNVDAKHQHCSVCFLWQTYLSRFRSKGCQRTIRNRIDALQIEKLDFFMNTSFFRFRGTARTQSARPRAVAPCGAGRPQRRLKEPTASGQNNGTSTVSMSINNENDQADRAISNGKLHALLHFHTRPINVVVFHGSDREYSFSGWFPA